MSPLAEDEFSVDELHLDSLHAYEDRQAIKRVVAAQLEPPLDLVKSHARLVRHAEQLSLGLAGQPGLEALRSQSEWAHAELRELFSTRVGQMLDWARRMRWSAENSYWSPPAWVAAARSLDAYEILLGMVMEHAHATSWKEWLRAFDFSSDWVIKWRAWEQASRKPLAASQRWMMALLDARPGSRAVEEALAQSHARLQYRYWKDLREGLARSQAREVLDTLESIGVGCDFSGLDLGLVFFSGSSPELHLRSPEQALAEILEFAADRPAPIRQWLSRPLTLRPDLLPAKLQVGPALHRRFLQGLARHGVASARNVRLVTEAVFPEPAVWESKFWAPLFAQFEVPLVKKRLPRSSKPKPQAPPPKKKPARVLASKKPPEDIDASLKFSPR